MTISSKIQGMSATTKQVNVHQRVKQNMKAHKQDPGLKTRYGIIGHTEYLKTCKVMIRS